MLSQIPQRRLACWADVGRTRSCFRTIFEMCLLADGLTFLIVDFWGHILYSFIEQYIH